VFSATVLNIDPRNETARIVDAIREHVESRLRRRGVVVGVSGGVDSAVVAALCVRALGRDRVLALLMPEYSASSDSLALGQVVVKNLNVQTMVEDIGPALEGLGCYRRQHDAIRRVLPQYDNDWKFKLVMPSHAEGDRFSVMRLHVETADGRVILVRLTAQAYREIVAATNFKQRVRKMLEYHHADRLHYAVAGTPNRLEFDQGFFVKQGDGAADLKPIAHLYKTQVYQLARYLEIPDDVTRRPPTTDTFSLSQTQEEFYFALPYDRMDLCLYGLNHGIRADIVAPAVGLTPEQVHHVFRDIEAKRRATRYQHASPLLVEPVDEV
jgi:NAD+ synthase